MEDNVLPSPAVAGVLNESYIEARLFTDMEEDPHHEHILELQDRLTGSVANPTFVLVDPATEKRLYLLQGKRSAETFARFLEAGKRKAEEKVARSE
jgi:hypothetical protein